MYLDFLQQESLDPDFEGAAKLTVIYKAQRKAEAGMLL